MLEKGARHSEKEPSANHTEAIEGGGAMALLECCNASVHLLAVCAPFCGLCCVFWCCALSWVESDFK